MTKNLKPYPIRVEEKLFNKFKVVAEANHRSIIGQLTYLIEREVNDYERDNGEINVDMNDLDE